MSVLTYNGVQLPYSNCTRFQQEVMYDDVGKTDWFCTQYAIEVQAVVNTAYLQLLAPSLVDSKGKPIAKNPADIMTAIRNQLMLPRRLLSFTFNGTELIPLAQTKTDGDQLPGTVDAQNGPKPISCKTFQLTDTSYLIDYNIIAHYWENPSAKFTNSPLPLINQSSSPILYNRWHETISIDNCSFSTKTREGKFVMRSDNAQGKTVDTYRDQFAVIGIPPGWVRMNSEYTVSPDGLGLSYRVTDRQVYKLPPKPAYQAEGDYIEYLGGGGENNDAVGLYRIGEVRIRLRGSPDVEQAELLDVAFGIAKKKFMDITATSQCSLSLALSCMARVSLYDADVEIRMRRAYFGQATTVADFPGFFSKALTTTPESDGETEPPTMPVRGQGNWVLKAAAYYDPNLSVVQLSQNPNQEQSNAGLEIGTAGVNVET